MRIIRFILWMLSYPLLWLLVVILWLWIWTTVHKEPEVKEQLLQKIETFYQPLRRVGWEEVSFRFLRRRVKLSSKKQ